MRTEILLDVELGTLEGQVRAATSFHTSTIADVAVLADSGNPKLGNVGIIVIRARAEGVESTVALANRVRSYAPHVGLFLVGLTSDRLMRRLPVISRAGVDFVFELDVAGDESALAEQIRLCLS